MLKYLDLPLITFCEFFGFSGQKKTMSEEKNVAPFPPDVDDVIFPLSNASITDESNTFSEVIDMAGRRRANPHCIKSERKEEK